ncbi:MAG: phosphoenolpyruvate carboxylase [Gammaproteobacteria bacterium]
MYFRPEDIPLKDDVNRLGQMLGRLLEELEGKALFAQVELARQAARESREEGGDATDLVRRSEALARLARVSSGLEPGEAMRVTRAFSAYFGLVNMAERVHRIRRRRDYLRAGEDQPESFVAVIRTLRNAGLTLEQVRAELERIEFTPVFTAHPTESTRRTLLVKDQRIAAALLACLDVQAMLPGELTAALATVRHELGLAWQTDEHFEQPTVADELEHVLFFLTDVVYGVLPQLDHELELALDAVYGEGAAAGLSLRPVRFASWVGGDMDGNPNVGAATIEQSLVRQRDLVIELYRAQVREVFEHLSQSVPLIAPSAALSERLAQYRESMPDACAEISGRYAGMPYRVFLWLVWSRLDYTRRDERNAYANVREFLDDLYLVADSLDTHGATGRARVDSLVLKVRTFGFHLATLDLRQDSAVHREAMGEVLADRGFMRAGASERAARVRAALDGDIPPGVDAPAGGALARCLEAFAAAADGVRRFGDDAIGLYIISMAEHADDALSVLYLARRAGLAGADGHVPLDIAPLFETVDDLDRAPETLAILLQDRVYREHLRARGERQYVMLGYSDSNKVSGMAASRYALYRAQRSLVEVAAGAPGGAVELTLFHGRGGTISRGGGRARNGILAEPPRAVLGRLRVTEQGEIIAQKYGLEDIALRTMETTVAALLERSALGPAGTTPGDAWMQALERLARHSLDAYGALVSADPRLIEYFRAATPIDVIERLRIGSRPPSRRTGGGVENLRAIPWVFAWTQSRHNFTGWYGVGAGLGALIDEVGMAGVREMASEWPMFTNLLDDTEMVLAKADMAIAERYAALAGDAGAALYPQLRMEFEQTREHICAIKNVDELLDRDPALQLNIRLRNPYIDPMSFIQIDLLERWRAGDREDAALEQALAATVRGIAKGMQNTG